MTGSEIIHDALVEKVAALLQENANLHHKIRWLQEELMATQATIARMTGDGVWAKEFDEPPHHISHS